MGTDFVLKILGMQKKHSMSLDWKIMKAEKLQVFQGAGSL